MQSEAEEIARQESAEPGSVPEGRSLSFSARARLDTIRFKQDKGYSIRRMVFVFGTTTFLLLSNTAFVALGYNGPVMEKYIAASFDLIMWVAIAYMSMGAVDRSNILRRWGENWSRRQGQ